MKLLVLQFYPPACYFLLLDQTVLIVLFPDIIYAGFEVLTSMIMRSSLFWEVSRDSAVGIATGYGLDD
jgi:hypothetical protein